MKLTIRIAITVLLALGLLLLSGGCAPQYQTTDEVERVQCTEDSHCNQGNACMVCQNNACVRKSSCCNTDAECGAGSRCWNVPGKAYG